MSRIVNVAMYLVGRIEARRKYQSNSSPKPFRYALQFVFLSEGRLLCATFISASGAYRLTKVVRPTACIPPRNLARIEHGCEEPKYPR